LDQLSYRGFNLLTTAPTAFKLPDNDYGQYENRPVYGYDDCFPSVSECLYPKSDWVVPDHGEVCWLPFTVEEKTDSLLFSVKSQNLPLILKRKLHFNEHVLLWSFEVQNLGSETLPFQHIIHPLMPLNEIVGIDAPGFVSVMEDIQKECLPIKTSDQLEGYLLNMPRESATMLFLRGIKKGLFKLRFKNGLILEVRFPIELFPTLGIWWNNHGYPYEDGIRRNECAFEPIPGPNSSLEDAYKEGSSLFVAPNQRLKWNFKWLLEIQ
jgi:hypothetical protein